jgi:hypothetical protein
MNFEDLTPYLTMMYTVLIVVYYSSSTGILHQYNTNDCTVCTRCYTSKCIIQGTHLWNLTVFYNWA